MEHLRLSTVDGYDIAAVLTRAGTRDVVIWMHGITVDKDEYLGFFRDGAKALASQGISSIQFDFRGHGQSSGSSLDFSIVAQNLDVQAVVEFIQRQVSRKARIHVVGASFGAPAAIFAAARYIDRVASVSLISPVLSYRRTFLEPETEWAKELFSARQLRRLGDSGRLYFDSEFCISPRLVEEMRIIRPDIALGDLQQRVLAVHGTRDSMVPFNATAQVCRGLEHVTLVTLDGADHGFMQEGDDEGITPQSIANKEGIYRKLEENVLCTLNTTS